ncbi:hypothetical protein QJS04_geneDACA014003 [Acorus gramineus]|uniref:biotin carboxylase n=1 Tax=Acorus gramineus TaxID=55184 RepID=A0AAV9AXK1_ACOGR|nr:hypothetical protein QJS04_geneDACA014003 [Acorus gramineus]
MAALFTTLIVWLAFCFVAGHRRSFLTGIRRLLFYDDSLAGFWAQHNGTLKHGRNGFLQIGHHASCKLVNFPKQRISCLNRKLRSRRGGGALSATCRDEKILVANRGEIAVRVIRTAHEMGIPCVAVYSTIDKDALHVRLADESVCIGEAPSSQSYLFIPNVLSAAVSRECTMLHPGYGFLAENARFVDICREHGINFIGPNPDSIRIMGDKSSARETMKKAGVPTVPGSEGLLQSTEEAFKLAHEIGFPVMIKATAGGGGRGMRLAKEPEEFVKLLHQAKSEAAAAFGNAGVYLEKYIQNPRHIEFQVLADKHGNVVHFGERDCSIQRRNQKLLEEAPSPALTEELRKAMGDAAVAAAASIGYVGVGTVEHPVTEMISSTDLIEEQIRVALGEKLQYKQDPFLVVSSIISAPCDSFMAGIPTTIDYHKLILDVEDFRNGKIDTAFIPKHENELAAPQKLVLSTAPKELAGASA